MDVKVAGIGSVPNGDYNHVSAHGNVELFRLVKCKSIVAKGKIKGESLECQKSAKFSGNATLSGKITAQELKASGNSCIRLMAYRVFSNPFSAVITIFLYSPLFNFFILTSSFVLTCVRLRALHTV